MPKFIRHIQIDYRSLQQSRTAAVSETSRSNVRSSIRNWSISLSGILLLTLLTVSCALKPKSTLVIGMELNYPPFEMVDPQGKPAGISVELAHELGKFLGKDIQIQNIPFDGLIPALKTAKIDLIISSMTETPERAKSIDFSEPYLRTGLCLLVNKSAPIDSIAQADRSNFSVAVKQGTTGQLYAQHHLRNVRILVLEKEDACVLEVVQNKAQAFIYDQMSIFKHWQQHQDSTKALLKPFQEEKWAVGIRSDDQALKAQVNAFLVVFKTNGGFDKLGDKYLKEQKEQFHKLGIPFYF
jgi:polar amino acid transport system substrate-binding protein